MKSLSNREYTEYFKRKIDGVEKHNCELRKYAEKQIDSLNHLTSMISPETFWQTIPKILGVDAKLTLLVELISYEDFSSDEIIRIVESDYSYYFKELCGYDLSMKTNPSIVFNVA